MQFCPKHATYRRTCKCCVTYLLTYFVTELTTDITKANALRMTLRIEEIVGQLKVIQKSKDSLKVTCITKNDKIKLMNVKSLLGHTIIVTEPFQLKRTKAHTDVTPQSGDHIWVHREITNEEMSISIGLKAERMLKKRGPNIITTEQMIVYCESELPPFVYDGWNRFKVSVYIPDLTRCYRCQQFKHKALPCRSKKDTCSLCSGTHETKNLPHQRDAHAWKEKMHSAHTVTGHTHQHTGDAPNINKNRKLRKYKCPGGSKEVHNPGC